MGNVNGREDGGGSPSGVEESGGGGGGGGGGRESNNSVQEEGMVAPDGLMGQSPPHSPRATHSPLMFTPQVASLSLTYVCVIWILFNMGLFMMDYQFIYCGVGLELELDLFVLLDEDLFMTCEVQSFILSLLVFWFSFGI